MKLKELDGFKLNELVYVPSENRYGKIVRIDGHVYPICLSTGGRFESKDLVKDLTIEIGNHNNEMFTMNELLNVKS